MDEAIIAERGGFRTRAELIHEAIENLLNELDFPEAPSIRAAEEGGVLSASSPEDALDPADALDGIARALSGGEREELAISDLAGTVLHPSAEEPSLVAPGLAAVRDEPLLGLHNRDYVSIWSLHRLARYTVAGPIGFDDYLDRVTKAAWYFGSRLAGLEREHPGRKLTVLFPTNLAKRPSAERGFQSFAVGGLARHDGDEVVVGSGPLFAWRAVQVLSADKPAIGVTDSGLRLINDLDGLSLELPHSRSLATRFLAYLAEHAPRDRWGFDHVVRVAVAGPSRDELVRSFAEAHAGWTKATASSVAQGYVARAREWGLLEPRLIDGRYWLTEAGRELAQEIDEGPAGKGGKEQIK